MTEPDRRGSAGDDRPERRQHEQCQQPDSEAGYRLARGASARRLTGEKQVVVPNFLFAAQEASGREQTPDASEYAEDTGEAPVHPASDRVHAALGSDEGVHGDVRPVRMRQLIA